MNDTPTRRRRKIYPLIRQIHLWIGAWGAIAAIIYGLSGLVLNHRFAIEMPQGTRETAEPVQVAVPEAARVNMQAMSHWLASEQHLRPLTARGGQPRGGERGGERAGQRGGERGGQRGGPGQGNADGPEHWNFGGGSATEGWSVEYVPGEPTMKLERSHFSPLAALSRLHKSGGGGIAWILLGDSFALAMILLGISGIVLWARGRSVRQWVFSVFGVAFAVIAVVLGAAYT